jgi:hypothetical protein
VDHRRRPVELRQPLARGRRPLSGVGLVHPPGTIHVVDLTSAIRSPSVRMDAGRAPADDVGTRPPDGLRRPPHGQLSP